MDISIAGTAGTPLFIINVNAILHSIEVMLVMLSGLICSFCCSCSSCARSPNHRLQLVTLILRIARFNLYVPLPLAPYLHVRLIDKLSSSAPFSVQRH